MTTDDYITTTGERWCLEGETLVGSGEVVPGVHINGFLVNNALVFAELRALRAQRDELLAASLRVVDWNGLNDPLTFDEVLDNLRAIAKEEA